MLARLCSKPFKLGFSSMWTEHFQICKMGLEKAEEPEIKLPTFVGSWKNQGNSMKTSTSASLIIPKLLIVWITTNWGNFLKKREYQIILSVSWGSCMQINNQQLKLDLKHVSGSKLGKEYDKTALKKTKAGLFNGRMWINNLLKMMKEQSEKSVLKLSIKQTNKQTKTEIMTSDPTSSWQTEGGKVEPVRDFIFLDSKITEDIEYSDEIKRHLLHEMKAMTNLDSVLKRRDITLLTMVNKVKATVFPVIMYGCVSWTVKKTEHWRILLNCGAWKTLDSLLNSKEIKPVNPKGNQPWILIGKSAIEAETLIFWPHVVKSGSLEKPWCWERLKAKGEVGAERELVRYHHWLNGLESLMESRGTWLLQSTGSQKVKHNLVTEELQLKNRIKPQD